MPTAIFKTRVALPIAILGLPLIVGCMSNLPDYVNVVDFPPNSCGSRWQPADIFSDPQLIALAKAVKKQDLREIDRLIAAGVDLNVAGKDNVTPLAYAMMLEKKKAFKRLLQKGANPNHLFQGTVPIIELAAHDGTDPEWLQLCLQHHGDPNVVNRLEGIPDGRQTPIYEAIDSGEMKNIELLIAPGSDLDHRNHNGNTPLLYGLLYGDYQVAYVMLEAGANFRAKNDQGWDVNYIAIRWLPETPPEDVPVPWWDKVLDFLEQHEADFATAEKRLAKDDPAAFANWEKAKQRRAAKKAAGK